MWYLPHLQAKAMLELDAADNEGGRFYSSCYSGTYLGTHDPDSSMTVTTLSKRDWTQLLAAVSLPSIDCIASMALPMSAALSLFN